MKWVEADATGSAFGVGPHALLSGTAYLDRDPALPFAYETLEDLRAELGYTMHYARRNDAHVLYLASRESRGGASVVPRVGRRLPAHVTALGQCLLSCLTRDEVDAVLPAQLEALTPHTVTDRDQLFAELDRARARGWAVEHEQGTEGSPAWPSRSTTGSRRPTRSAARCRRSSPTTTRSSGSRPPCCATPASSSRPCAAKASAEADGRHIFSCCCPSWARPSLPSATGRPCGLPATSADSHPAATCGREQPSPRSTLCRGLPEGDLAPRAAGVRRVGSSSGAGSPCRATRSARNRSASSCGS